ncbi:Vitamin B12 import ATP-binding protein BtuD [Streptomyces griseoloalbus]
MAEIVLEGVTKRYPDGSLAVRDVNLDIADGEFVILVGPSGCGKSTTLNMIAGLEDITEGTLRIGGQVVNDLAPKERDVAMVFQSYALYPHMSVRENMGFPLRLAKVDKATIDRKVDEAARVLDLVEFLDRKPANLSGGQRQRVAMGRAIVRDPKAFLMDEPLSNLDAKLRVQMRTQISRIQRRLGTTTVYVTHDQTEAMTLGDRVVVMRQGLVQQVGTPAELYDMPRNLFVAGFIGSPAMNFVQASLTPDALRTPLGDLPLDDRRAPGSFRRAPPPDDPADDLPGPAPCPARSLEDAEQHHRRPAGRSPASRTPAPRWPPGSRTSAVACSRWRPRACRSAGSGRGNARTIGSLST